MVVSLFLGAHASVACGGGSGDTPYLVVEEDYPEGSALLKWDPIFGTRYAYTIFSDDTGPYRYPGLPSISFDGSRIAFAGVPVGETYRKVFTVTRTGATTKQVTTGSRDDTYPSWSPDGSSLVLSSTVSGVTAIWTCRTDGTDLHALTSPPSGVVDYDPHFSPDGKRIVFVRKGGLPQIWLMDADGGNAKAKTTSNLNWNVDPSWSPDGTQIAWASTGVSDEFERIWVMKADAPVGSQVDPMSPGVGSNHRCPRWGTGKTGLRLFFILDQENPDDVFSDPDSVWSMKPDGSDMHAEFVPPHNAGWFDAHR